MGKKTLYLCGAVTSNKNYEKDFFYYKGVLKACQYEVINPVQLCKARGLTNWSDCMKFLIPIMIEQSDGIALIPSELPSKGRDLELKIAEALSIEIHTVDEWQELSYEELRKEL